jgi:hypothetical protein
VVRSLIYIMVYIRPDIAFTLGKLSQYMKDPSKTHWIYLKALMRYIQLSLGLRIHFGPSDKLDLVVYIDAD